MADKTSETGRTQIIIALLGTLGVIAAALFANWDKIFSHRAPAATKVEAPAAASPPPPTAAVTGVPDIAGTWHDADGSYEFTQNGADYRYRFLQNGAEVGTGTGRIEGRRLHHMFEGGSSGSCDGVLAADGRSIAGACTSGTDSFAFRITR